MQANELKIGNLVNTEDGISKVMQLGITPHNFIAVKTIENDIWNNKFEPIPLTEEWLEKFGFKYSVNKDSGCGIVTKNITFNLWFDNGKIIYWKARGSITLKHVHQLQNLFFTLMSEELELK